MSKNCQTKKQTIVKQKDKELSNKLSRNKKNIKKNNSPTPLNARKTMIKRIGIKNENGENVCIVDHKKPIPINFWNKYEHIKTVFISGDTMAFTIVKKKPKGL